MIVEGASLDYPRDVVLGVDFRWLRRRSLQLTDAPAFYSVRARMLGKLCPSCDLGLPFSCECPWSEPIAGRPDVPIVLKISEEYL